MQPYPLTFEPILKEKVWGGRELERLNKSLPQGAKVGECWEIADMAATSTDGAGEPARSIITHGEMRGLTLADAIVAMGSNLMGGIRLSNEGGFPLLVKFLDARESLSVQVHPSPAYAAAHPHSHLKTESWYVVAADPGAVIYKGLHKGVSRETFASHIADGSVVKDMIAIPANAGDFHHLPSGTCHAVGAGLVLAEVQTPSDTTFRVYDWGRTGRALHVEEAMACIEFGPPEQLEPLTGHGHRRTLLVSTPFYAVTEVRLDAGEPEQIRVGGRSPRIWVCISGGGMLKCQRGEYEEVALVAGTTVLLPASLAAGTFVASRPTVLLDVMLPG